MGQSVLDSYKNHFHFSPGAVDTNFDANVESDEAYQKASKMLKYPDPK